jgi:hypothetical protein
MAKPQLLVNPLYIPALIAGSFIGQCCSFFFSARSIARSCGQLGGIISDIRLFTRLKKLGSGCCLGKCSCSALGSGAAIFQFQLSFLVPLAAACRQFASGARACRFLSPRV